MRLKNIKADAEKAAKSDYKKGLSPDPFRHNALRNSAWGIIYLDYFSFLESNNCRDDIKNGMSEKERIKAADFYGPNWANIMSGLGDQ